MATETFNFFIDCSAPDVNDDWLTNFNDAPHDNHDRLSFSDVPDDSTDVLSHSSASDDKKIVDFLTMIPGEKIRLSLIVPS